MERITISRDLPFAQRRAARESGFEGIRFLSDYRSGAFGRSLGLLAADNELLARALLVVDREGIVRHVQVVPEITHLPDMRRAVAVAERLAAE